MVFFFPPHKREGQNFGLIWLICIVIHLCLERSMGDIVTKRIYSPTQHTGFGDGREDGVRFFSL